MTSELQPLLEPDGPIARHRPEVLNTASGAVGSVVQAGTIHGDVHLHAAPPSPAQVIPHQLPAAPRLFAGRTADLIKLDHALTTASPTGADTAPAVQSCDDLPVVGTTVMVSAIGGAGGIGKTWLALAWAHDNLRRFPDGQLFVDLHGFSPSGAPVDPAVAVRGFLDALGVEPSRIPTDLDAQAAMYRSLVASRRMLIVLDNAASADQVVPLLPGSRTCTVLVTSRSRLASLIDRHGARHLALGVLSYAESRALLAARIGADRVAIEPDAVNELVMMCKGYPLALAITARNAATRPNISLTEVAVELRELGLEMLDHDTDPAASLPTVLSWSLRHLTHKQRSTFALLGIAPGRDTTLPAVISLTGLPPAHARRALSVLEETSLIERRPGGRYTMHDLVRDYAATTAHDLPEPVRKSALERVVSFYLHNAYAAERLVAPYREPIQLDPPPSGVQILSMSSASVAAAWLDGEHINLLAAQNTASVHNWHRMVWHLAWSLTSFHYRRGHLRDDRTVWRTALAAARHLTDENNAHTHRLLARAHSALERHEDAIKHLEHAATVARASNDLVQQAHAQRELARIWDKHGQRDRAFAHATYALGLYRALDNTAWTASALNAAGWYAAHLGRYDEGGRYGHAALALYERHHNPIGEASTLDVLGYVAHNTGHLDSAIYYYRRAADLSRANRDIRRTAIVLDGLGHSYLQLGHRDEAGEAWLEALELYRAQGRDTDAELVQRQLDNLYETGRDDPH
ncbi:ATP-binding protein [Saccharothrix saharensis]|uniref:ATP-binding protein n=1 Tax=Saccharothrix saharensis TaxID=571190 RepID=UPI0036BAE487